MLPPSYTIPFIAFSLIICGTGVAYSQAYPNKPVRIVTSETGSSVDFTSRLIAQGLSGGLGQAFIIDNRPSGVIPGEIVYKAAPDGYTLLVSASALWLAPLLQHNVPYDPMKDFLPISMLVRSPNILVVHPSLPVRSVKELIALAKARPGELNYASTGAGGSMHLAAELFKAMAGVNIVRIAYRGGAQAVNDLIAGQVQVTFATPTSVLQHVKSGKLRGLAVTGTEPSAIAPALPTVTASGLPGYGVESYHGIFAPAKTPEVIIKRLNQEVVRVLRTIEVERKLLSIGVEAVGNPPEAFAALIKGEIVKFGKIIRDAGIKAD